MAPSTSAIGGGSTGAGAGIFPSTPATPAVQDAPVPSGQNPYLSPAEIRYIVDGCNSDMRTDGRSNRDFRPYHATFGADAAALSSASSSAAGGNDTSVSSSLISTSMAPLVLSNGSSRISLPGSDTDVLCSVRAELAVPSAERPSEGVVEMNVDLMPAASSASGGGDNRRRRTEEMEIATVLTNLLLPHVVDRSALCIIPGKYVWRLAIDVLVLACDGNVVDVCALSIRAAVRGTLLPLVTPVAKAGADKDDGGVDGDTGGGTATGRVSDDFIVDGDIAKASIPPGAQRCPVVVTVFVLDKERGGSVFIVDARSDEELCSATRISLSIDPDGNVCGIYKHGSAPSLGDEGNYSGSLQVGQLTDVTSLAASTSKCVMDMMNRGLGTKSSNVASDDLLRGHFELR